MIKNKKWWPLINVEYYEKKMIKMFRLLSKQSSPILVTIHSNEIDERRIKELVSYYSKK